MLCCSLTVGCFCPNNRESWRTPTKGEVCEICKFYLEKIQSKEHGFFLLLTKPPDSCEAERGSC